MLCALMELALNSKIALYGHMCHSVFNRARPNQGSADARYSHARPISAPEGSTAKGPIQRHRGMSRYRAGDRGRGFLECRTKDR
ncbi:hypothetical protein HYPGJ_20468 [Hyphomicrobium sp. GJ21]|nr:hypothetical protein HYPGJ_20468 [Hyphomicrobium sp. GJ21]